MTSTVPYPDFFRLRQQFARELVADIPTEVELQLKQLQLHEKIKPGQSVAITAGSRGIANVALILRAVVQHMRQLKAQPFLVPAMGSHGGGTVAGQLALLHDYGITEEFCGCPIRASMETVVVCQAEEGFPVHFDRFAHEADHVFICNRVKPHTNFAGDIESGLMKMMLIGLGKHHGAKIYHRAIMNHSFGQIVRSVAREVLSRCGVVGGLAILENAYDQTAQLTAVEPTEFETREKQLLAQVKTWQPKLPFEEADILILDQIGKNISGSGLDTNLIGRKYNDHEPRDFETPKIKRIFIRGLTEQSHGNATGIGIGEFCLSRVVEQMDVEKTRINCLTGGHVTAAMIPIHYPTDREVLQRALPSIGLIEPPEARVLWIPDTLHLAEVECSRRYYEQAQQREDLELLTDLRPLTFDAAGMLPAQFDFAAAPSSETRAT